MSCGGLKFAICCYFSVGAKVVDRGTLKTILVALGSLFGTVVPILIALSPEVQVGDP